MKKILFLFAATVMALTFYSCHRVIKEIVIPADTKITFVVPTEKEGEDYLILAADTNQDGCPDTKIMVADWPAIIRICLLKEAYPDKDIRIKTNNLNLGQGNSSWKLTARTASAAEKTIFVN